MNWRKTAPVIAGAVILASGIGNVQAHAVATVLHKIKQVVLDKGNLRRTLPPGYTIIDRKRIWCGYYPSCTFAMSIMANVGQATCKDEWGIDGLVDGNSVDGGPLVEALPNAGNTQTHTWQGVYTTKNIRYHTLTFQLYLPCSANLNQWSVRYLLTTP